MGVRGSGVEVGGNAVLLRGNAVDARGSAVGVRDSQPPACSPGPFCTPLQVVPHRPQCCWYFQRPTTSQTKTAVPPLPSERPVPLLPFASSAALSRFCRPERRDSGEVLPAPSLCNCTAIQIVELGNLEGKIVCAQRYCVYNRTFTNSKLDHYQSPLVYHELLAVHSRPPDHMSRLFLGQTIK